MLVLCVVCGVWCVVCSQATMDEDQLSREMVKLRVENYRSFWKNDVLGFRNFAAVDVGPASVRGPHVTM